MVIFVAVMEAPIDRTTDVMNYPHDPERFDYGQLDIFAASFCEKIGANLLTLRSFFARKIPEWVAEGYLDEFANMLVSSYTNVGPISQDLCQRVLGICQFRTTNPMDHYSPPNSYSRDDHQSNRFHTVFLGCNTYISWQSCGLLGVRVGSRFGWVKSKPYEIAYYIVLRRCRNLNYPIQKKLRNFFCMALLFQWKHMRY